ncbi:MULTISPECIES: sensor histidine kinase [unclassified Janthinobacterium]|uniref:sensor histidine kinase n=1 Tax=unclassified Janthinobacterium TaxID=2610881 RepID=UPI001614FB57|nr:MULTISPECIES: sensor histidine kinase [unclassified Janthinobacterium]MBB5366957.1 two-component system osmolarity sensor histidine kinase EnvZ [Janthinobacterium sp. K2C7]MBB5380565.1 two-component system osmolarity sensor histidine kinase EnvZ [Janthinobacterium sp. K2Li3]MBB5385339.1 two-component system osmolarity sensor histidine kinase EnvZ [Janthinobacterium sp. K2E3]
MKLVPDISLARLKSGLFWRTFLLLGTLTTVSMSTWIGMISVIQREPQAQQISAQIISVVTITHAALTHSAPELRRELLFDLVSSEGIRIFSLEDDDHVDPPPDNYLMPEIETLVKAKLGKDTRFSARVNGVAGFWISFKIDDDEYWLMLDRERLRGLTGFQWLGWASLVSLLSLLGAAIISSLINLPLSRLTAAARDIAKGKQPALLPEKGPIEIIEANRSFNQMVDDLKQVESDRAVILAGISHDLRTPLARMQLEVEMANLSDEAREGIQSDIGQMDAIIGQFLDYAKPTEASSFIEVDLSGLLSDLAREAMRLPDVKVTAEIAEGAHAMGNATDLRRVLNNLVENARRYGKTEGSEITEIDFACQVKSIHGAKRVVIEVQDHGPGVPADKIEQMLKPFTRLDSARGQANGAGLGLAIVDRVLLRHGAELQVRNREGGGLAFQISLPAV